MPTYLCSYVSKERKALSRYGLGSAVRDLADSYKGDPTDLSTVRVERHEDGEQYWASFDRTIRREILSSSPLRALMSFLHTDGLPDGIDHTRIVIRQVEDAPPVEVDDDNLVEPPPVAEQAA